MMSYECWDVWDHLQLHRSFKSLFSLTTKNSSSCTLLALNAENPPVTSGFSHKRPIIWKMLPYHDMNVSKENIPGISRLSCQPFIFLNIVRWNPQYNFEMSLILQKFHSKLAQCFCCRKMLLKTSVQKDHFVQASVCLTHCGLVMPFGDKRLGNIGSGSGLLLANTKPLPEQMLTYHR